MIAACCWRSRYTGKTVDIGKGVDSNEVGLIKEVDISEAIGI